MTDNVKRLDRITGVLQANLRRLGIHATVEHDGSDRVTVAMYDTGAVALGVTLAGVGAVAELAVNAVRTIIGTTPQVPAGTAPCGGCGATGKVHTPSAGWAVCPHCAGKGYHAPR